MQQDDGKKRIGGYRSRVSASIRDRVKIRVRSRIRDKVRVRNSVRRWLNLGLLTVIQLTIGPVLPSGNNDRKLQNITNFIDNFLNSRYICDCDVPPECVSLVNCNNSQCYFPFAEMFRMLFWDSMYFVITQFLAAVQQKHTF